MAHTNVSATLSFVKKYPITLCGFSLLFMPSVHRLLLFFTPLLLSTAIFVVAMISWGPNNSSAERNTKGSLTNDDDQWTINGLNDEEGSSEPDPDLTEEPDPDLHVEHVETAPTALHAERVESDPDLRVEPDPHLAVAHHVEPDPDLHVEHAEPDPDLHVEYIESDPDLHVEHAEPDPDLHVEHGPELHVEPDPDLHAGELHVEPDPDLVGEDYKASHADGGHHNHVKRRRVLFSDEPKLAKAVERELAGLEASLSSSIKRSSSIEEEIQLPDKPHQNSEPSSGSNVAFPGHHQKAVWQALEAAA